MKILNPSFKDLDPTSEEVKEVAKLLAQERGIKSYKSMSEDELLSALISSKPVKKSEKPKIKFSKARIEKIRKEFDESRHKFSKSEINEIRRNLYEIEKEKNLFALRMEEIVKNHDELERNLSKTKKYYDYDDATYRNVKDVNDLFDLSIDENYYKLIITNGAFNNNNIQYESRRNKDKILTVNEYLDIIRPYLSYKINDHKTQGEWKIHSGDTITDHKTQGEWKILLTIVVNFISSKDSDETRTMHTKSNNLEIMMGSETDKIIKDLFKSL